MKILMLSSFYSPVLGGISTYIESLTRELVKKGNQVTICTLGQLDLPETDEENGVKIIRIEGLFQRIPFLFKNTARKYHPPVRDWLISKKLTDIIRQEKPDIIHTHCWFLYSMLPLKNKFKIPLVHHLHDYGLFCPKMLGFKKDTVCNSPSIWNCLLCMSRRYGLLRSMLAYCGVRLNDDKLKKVDIFIAPSDYVHKTYGRNLRKIGKNIIIIPNFLLPNIGNSQKHIEDLPFDFILYVGLLMPHKGVDVLVEAYGKLKTATKLVIVGIEHPDYHYQSEDNIVVLKNLPHEAVMSIMSKCRFIVVPSLWPENFSMVALESMSSGKAIIASKTGGLPELILDEETGILVTPNDSDKLAEAISSLLQKPEEISRMGRNGYSRFTNNYTPDRVISRIIDLYKSLI